MKQERIVTRTTKKNTLKSYQKRIDGFWNLLLFIIFIKRRLPRLRYLLFDDPTTIKKWKKEESTIHERRKQHHFIVFGNNN